MTGKELFAVMAKGEIPKEIPFIPTIFEHSARVIGKTPSEIAQDEDLIVESQLACYEIYRHDLISIGVDIYNLEYEALGAKVFFPENEELPSISETMISTPGDIDKLRVPDPEKDGRMPMFLNAVQRVNEKVGNEVIVNGTVVGPFTLAAIMRGFENFVMDLVMEPDFAYKLMEFANKVSLAFAESFIKRGVGLSINESWIAPPLLSPAFYAENVVGYEKELIQSIKKLGQKNVALISGGNTTEIVDDMITTGTSLLLADSECDRHYYKKVCAKNNILMRASIASKIVEDGNEVKMREAADEVIKDCRDYSGFIFGCGIVSYDTKPENVVKLKRIVRGY
ncbi:MAG: uroporphyrinogen decarboxylase family protein [Clostridia bacterium]|nr:uroporphyrinogen decarboxylase family protein [Clostridia bacterium]MBN2883599.1 uroporphyrinogen decarboxylase family protein [Clostridia bacterium]